MSTNWLKIASGATDGGDLYAQSGPGTAFSIGQTLWISCIYKADRITGTNSLTFRLSVLWYNSAGALLSTTSNDVVITGTVGETFLKFAVVVPANATSAKVKYQAIPGGGTMQHDLYFRSCRLTAFEPGATEGAQVGTNLTDSSGTVVGDSEVLNEHIATESLSATPLFANPDFGKVHPGSSPARPLGIIAQNQAGTISFLGNLSYVGGTLGGDLAVGEGTNSNFVAYFPLWRVNPKAKYRARGRAKGNVAVASGFFLRFLELDSEPSSSAVYMVHAVLGGAATQVAATRERTGGTTALTGGTSIENAALTTSYQNFNIQLTPTATAKFMGLALFSSVPASRDMHFESLIIEELTPTSVLEYDYTGDLNATFGSNWDTNLSNRPVFLTDGRIPAALGSNGRLFSTTVVLPVQGAGQTYNYTGTISYATAAGTPATCDITVTAGNVVMGSTSISYNQMTAQLTGTGGTVQPVTYLYVQTNSYTAGAHTLLTTTTKNNIYANDNNVFIGSIPSFTFPTSGTGGGGGLPGDGCPWAEAFVHTLRGWIRAKEVVAGDHVLCLNRDGAGADDWAEVTSNEPHFEPCYIIQGKLSRVRVTVSHSTPITLRDGSVIKVAEIDGHELPFEGDGRFWWEPCEIIPLEPRAVCKIKCGGRTYSAGDTAGWGILQHNPKP